MVDKQKARQHSKQSGVWLDLLAVDEIDLNNHKIRKVLHRKTVIRGGSITNRLHEPVDFPLLFIGAGFSKGIYSKMPLLDELSELVLSKGNEDKPNFSRWGINNVEDLMSFLSSHMPWESLSEKHEKLAMYHSLIQYITEVITSKSEEFNTLIKKAAGGSVRKKRWFIYQGSTRIFAKIS